MQLRVELPELQMYASEFFTEHTNSAYRTYMHIEDDRHIRNDVVLRRLGTENKDGRKT